MVTHLDVHRLGTDQAGLFRHPGAAAVGFAVADTGTTAHACANGNTAAGIPAFAVYAAGVLQGFRVQVVAYLYVQVLRLQVGSKIGRASCRARVSASRLAGEMTAGSDCR